MVVKLYLQLTNRNININYITKSTMKATWLWASYLVSAGILGYPVYIFMIYVPAVGNSIAHNDFCLSLRYYLEHILRKDLSFNGSPTTMASTTARLPTIY